MAIRPRFLAVALVALFLVGPPAAVGAEEETPLPTVLAAGTVVADLGSQRVVVPFSRTAFGPLFSLAPIVASLGGALEVGPLEQSHRLTLEGVDCLFGVGNGVLTAGRKIISLSQPPQVSEDGLRVPLDLIERTYGDLLGFEISWSPNAQSLVMRVRTPRELSLTVDLVHVPGITTVVLHLPG